MCDNRFVRRQALHRKVNRFVKLRVHNIGNRVFVSKLSDYRLNYGENYYIYDDR
jgi:hypothetical protein